MLLRPSVRQLCRLGTERLTENLLCESKRMSSDADKIYICTKGTQMPSGCTTVDNEKCLFAFQGTCVSQERFLSYAAVALIVLLLLALLLKGD